ncbi:MAG: NAD-dependent epimerase/dehydratase family protein [Candidatus Omnitrophota bacterium]|jgi:nucleoside-diphosphate-sugar epimerase
MKTLSMKDRILIVGGTGFIGSHLAGKCLEFTPHVTCLVLPQDKRRINGVRTLYADIADLKRLKKVLVGKRFDYVFNLSGYIDHTPYFSGGKEVVKAHFTGLVNLIEALDRKSLKAFVAVGTSDEYGNSRAPQKESMRECPISPYAFSKTASSYFINMLYGSEGFPGVVLRLFLVYGPGQDNKRFLPQVIEGCLKDEAFKTSKGLQLRDLCYIDDVCEAFIAAALSSAAKGRVINIGSGKRVQIKDVVKKIMAFTGGGKPIFGAYPYKKNENMALYADIALAKSLLKWKPRTSLELGLKKTIRYYKENMKTGRR